MPDTADDRPSPFPAGTPTRTQAAELDSRDPLASARARFSIPPGTLYLDGNSLGALPAATQARVARAVDDEWGGDLIAGWTKHGWMDLPARIGAKIARLVGAGPGDVLACDTTTVNLYKLLAAALAERPGRRRIVSERDNFPTDLYVAEGLVRTLGKGHRLVLVERAEDVVAAIDDDTAVVMLTQVDYRTGALHDMKAVTRAAHAKGALVLWDLAHSAGALPIDLAGCDADYAVGCGYKYLNGGPGAPAFLYVAPRLQASFETALQGWLGHAAPFAFEPHYRPAPGLQRAIVSSPSILSLLALECGVDTFEGFGMDEVRAKSLALTGLFRTLVDSRAAELGLACATPAADAARGSQVCYRHPNGYEIVQALIARRVVGDFRTPDIARFGFTPLYLRHVDVWDAAAALVDVVASRAYENPKFAIRAKVT